MSGRVGVWVRGAVCDSTRRRAGEGEVPWECTDKLESEPAAGCAGHGARRLGVRAGDKRMCRHAPGIFACTGTGTSKAKYEKIISTIRGRVVLT